MPRKVPTEHKHEPPSPTVTTLVETVKEAQCPNEARIEAIERQLAKIQAALETRQEHLPAVIDDEGSEYNEQRFAAMSKQITNLREQVAAVQDLPRLSPDDVNSLSTALNTRVGKMIEDAITKEVTQIKIRISSMERTSHPSLAKDVELLGNIVTETGKLVAHIDQRGHDLEGEVTAARSEIQNMHAHFNQQMARSLSAVVDTFQGEPV